MDVQKYKILYKEGEARDFRKEIKIYCTYCSSADRRRSTGIHREDKKQYWDARHNCWAYSIGEKQPALRCSDDGEPSGTAGKPMLEVLTGQELHKW